MEGFMGGHLSDTLYKQRGRPHTDNKHINTHSCPMSCPMDQKRQTATCRHLVVVALKQIGASQVLFLLPLNKSSVPLCVPVHTYTITPQKQHLNVCTYIYFSYDAYYIGLSLGFICSCKITAILSEICLQMGEVECLHSIKQQTGLAQENNKLRN